MEGEKLIILSVIENSMKWALFFSSSISSLLFSEKIEEMERTESSLFETVYDISRQKKQ